MKNIFKFIPLAALAIMASCGLDNYDEPESTLLGQVVYNGEPVQVRGTGEAVRLYLYQDGYELHDPITVYVGQDGSFSAKLFDGEYKMTTISGNGPWENSTDTTVIKLKGSTSVTLNVTPFFTISGANISISGNTLNASLTINQVVSSATLEKVYLILSKTQFVDEVNNIFRADITDVKVGSNTLSADLSGSSDVANAKYIFGRIGVKTSGREQAIWSSVVQLK